MPAWSPVTLPGSTPKGPYSPGVKAGPFVHVSGQVPRDPASGELRGRTIEAQSRAVLENVRGVLHAAGATLADVVSVIVYLADENDWEAFNAVYREFFSPPFPSRTAVGARLRGILVEVSAVAYVGDAAREAVPDATPVFVP